MKVQKFLLIGSYYFIVACLSCESISSADERNDSFRRQILDLPSAYEYYDSQCCSGNDADKIYLNPCPQSPKCYSADNCNRCCQGGVSSLKLKWHGKCGGNLNLNTESLNCKAKIRSEVGKSGGGPMFVDCHCYDEYLTTVNEESPSNMDCFLSGIRQVPEDEKEVDICIVSVDVDGKVDLNSNLANPLSLTWKMTPTSIDEEEMTITHLDVSCSGGLPIYPGYGKLANTCPSEGFIDLDGGLHMPDEISHLDGLPPIDMSWYEFIDGTSSGFWPDSNVINLFNPTFAVCECVECKLPSTSPSSLLSQNPSKTNNPSPNMPPTSKPQYSSTLPPSSTIEPNPTRMPQPQLSPQKSPQKSPESPPTRIPATELPSTSSTTKGGKSPLRPPARIPTTGPTPSTFEPTFTPNPEMPSLSRPPSTCDYTSCAEYAQKNCFTLESGVRGDCMYPKPSDNDRKLQLENDIAYHRAKIDKLRKSKIV